MKTAVIGSRGHKQRSDDLLVDSFGWEDIGRIKNLRDYDRVLLNLLSVDPSTVDWSHFRSLLNPITVQDILQPGGQIVVLGDPRFEIPGPGGDEEVTALPFLFWTLGIFHWDDAPGDTVECRQGYSIGEYAEYAKYLTKWKYSLLSAEINRPAFESIFDLDKIKKADLAPRFDIQAICWNRYGNSLVFEARLLIETIPDRYSRPEAKIAWGRIVMLPLVDLPEEEVLVLILRDLLGVEAALPEPEWLSEYVAPGQRAIDDEIEAGKQHLATSLDRLKSATQRRQEARESLRLLYDKGESLEEVVRRVLGDLGAVVETPSESGKEDGWLAVELDGQQFEGVLEVKGTRNAQFGEDGLKQLAIWVDRGIRNRQKKYKGVFVGNSSINEAVEGRVAPFSPGFARTAELHEFVAIQSRDVFEAFVLDRRGELDRDAFWRQLFSTSGVFDATPYTSDSTDQ